MPNLHCRTIDPHPMSIRILEIHVFSQSFDCNDNSLEMPGDPLVNLDLSELGIPVACVAQSSDQHPFQHPSPIPHNLDWFFSVVWFQCASSVNRIDVRRSPSFGCSIVSARVVLHDDRRIEGGEVYLGTFSYTPGSG